MKSYKSSNLENAVDTNAIEFAAITVLQWIRQALKEKSYAELERPIQTAETFTGGKNKNLHTYKKLKESLECTFMDKTPMFGLLSNVQENTVVIPDTQEKTFKSIINPLAEEGSIINIDQWKGLIRHDKKYQHVVLNHTWINYVLIRFHTNSIVGFWSLPTRGVYGNYHNASAKHFHHYTPEFMYSIT